MSVRKKFAITVLAVAIVFSAVIIGYFKNFPNYFSQKIVKNPTVKNKVQQPVISKNTAKIKLAATSSKILLPGFKLYKNPDFGFEIQYPSSWTVSEEIMENVRGEMVKEFFFKKPGSDLRFAILPRDGLSYGVETVGTSTQAYIGGSLGVQTKYVLKDGRRLWLLFPQTGILNWLQDLGRIDTITSASDPIGDTIIFEKMLNSFKLSI